MKSPAEIIRQLLLDLSLGTEDGDWKIFVGFLPDQPPQAICVYDTPGAMDGRMMGTGEKIEHYGVQIRVRGPSYPDTWAKIRNIALGLDDQERTIVAFTGEEAYLVQNISRTGSILPLGIEEQGSRRHHHFTMNAVTTLFETTDEVPFLGSDWSPYWVRN